MPKKRRPGLKGELLALLTLLLAAELEALATLDGMLVRQRALCALQLQHDLLRGLDLNDGKKTRKETAKQGRKL